MPFPPASYDFATRALMTRAFDDAWRHAEEGNLAGWARDDEAVRREMAARITGKVNLGERNVENLTVAALRAIDGRNVGKRTAPLKYL
jgi:hypothetical protein